MNGSSPTRRQSLQGLTGGLLSILAGCSSDSIIVGTDGSERTQDGDDTAKSPTVDAPTASLLTVELNDRPRGFDPIVHDDIPTRVVYQHIFEGLYEYAAGIEPVPRLARGQPDVSRDGQRWTIELRPGVTFQNGAPVSPTDIKYSFEAPIEEFTDVRPLVQNIEEISSIDASTVEFSLEDPDAAFIHTLTRPIVPMSVREADPATFDNSEPIGSGPFSLDEQTNRGEVRLRRWSEYWGSTRPELERLVFRFDSRDAERLSRFSEGTTDVTELATNEAWRSAVTIDDATIDAAPQLVYFYLAFNCRTGPTSDPRVREAVDYAVDLDRAIDDLIPPAGVRQYSPFPEPISDRWQFPTGEWAEIPHDKDMSRARQLFEEAGVSTDYPWRVIVPPDPRRVELAATVVNGLREAGFSEAQVDRLEWGAFLGRYASGRESDYNMYLLGWRHIPDPGAFTYPLFARTPEVLGVTNGTFYGATSERGQAAVRKLARAREVVERTRRRRLYTEAVTTILEDRVHLPGYNIKHSFAVRDVVQDLDVVPTDDKLHVFSQANNVSLSGRDTGTD